MPLTVSTDDVIKLQGIQEHDKVDGAGIPDGTYVSRVLPGRLEISNDATAGVQTSSVRVTRALRVRRASDNVWRVEEAFRETSEVSTTLLGIPRAEVQLSLFSNVSSYGLNNEDFEFYTFNSGNSFGSWDTRATVVPKPTVPPPDKRTSVVPKPTSRFAPKVTTDVSLISNISLLYPSVEYSGNTTDVDLFDVASAKKNWSTCVIRGVPNSSVNISPLALSDGV